MTTKADLSRKGKSRREGGNMKEEVWGKYQEVAKRFEHKVKFEDREDIRQEIILEIVSAKARNGDKPFTGATMYKISSYVVADYWRKQKRGPQILSLNETIEDGEGNETELIEMLADDNDIDLDAWLDAKVWLSGCPRRLIEIARNRVEGIPLQAKDQECLRRFRKKRSKKALVSVGF